MGENILYKVASFTGATIPTLSLTVQFDSYIYNRTGIYTVM